MQIFNVPVEFISRKNNDETPLPDYRTEFMRDRDRVLYATAFRRLAGKTQILIRKLFEAYYTHPQQLPDGPILHFLVDVGAYKSIDYVKGIGIGEARCEFQKIWDSPNIHMKCVLMRRICDHIASMTDQYAINEYDNLYG